jgi:drug/metabolite transporter (DMT)-like permease
VVCARGGPGVESETVTEGKSREAILTEASLLLAVLFLGTNPVAVKYAVLDVPPLPFVALRFTLAGLVVLGLVLLIRPGEGPGRRDLLVMAGLGLVGVGITNVAFTLGVSMTTASDTALIYSAVPVWGMLLGLALGLERPTLWGVLGVALAFFGVGVVVYGGLGGGGGSSLGGDLLVVVATVCWGSYTVLSLPLLRKYSPLVVAAYTMLFGGLGVMPLALPGFVAAEWGEVGVGTWGAVAYSALLVGAFGFAAWQAGISRTGANRVLVYQYLITLVGVASGVALLGESLTVNKILGGVVILLGVYLARRQ